MSSSSLIPDDPSVLLTTAGMQQFKQYYGDTLNPKSDFGSSRTASIQKCFRTSDIEEVGDEHHLTFFEMMGNFSFGPVGDDSQTNTKKDGYFKRASIVWAWQFLTETLGINPERMHVSVFEGDDETEKDTEAERIWKEEIGLSSKQIRNGGRKDNFWGPTGTEGPCGPTAEIYVDDVEVWNIVFNQYYASPKGNGLSYKPVENPGVDTGMGFERLLAVVEGKENIFQTSAFKDIINTIDKSAPQLTDRTVRIFADHIRGALFLIGDGVLPSNKEVGYILRRLLRRIIGLKLKYDVHTGLFESVSEVVAKQYGDIYPEIADTKHSISVWQEEFSKFQEVINKGMKMLEKYDTITGADAFYLYESFGLPFELTKELAPSSAIKNLTYADFEKAFKKHQKISRAGIEKKFGGHGLILDTGELKAANEEEQEQVIKQHTATHLIQWALREVLGEEVEQRGSDITAQRLRFDFSFDRKLTDEEKEKIEKLVNEQIKNDLKVSHKEMPKEEALKKGVLAFFKEKYPDIVTVYSIGDISKELCGGPHVSSTKEIGEIKILKEESVGKGVRRIRATVT